MATTPVGGSSSNAAAEAARQRQIAEARARAAAEARARAAAQAQAQAAAQAQARAEKLRTSTGNAQDKARQDAEIAGKAQKANQAAQERKTTAQQELQQRQAELDAHNKDVSFHGDSPSQKEAGAKLQKQVEEAQAKFDKAHTAASRIQEATQKALNTAATSRRDALSQANATLQAQKDANGAALQAGLPEPFRAANNLRDVYDAGNLDPKAQEQLFGSRTVVSQQEAVQSDTKAVADATQLSPRAGAQALNQALAQGTDPAYRQALTSATTASADKITAALSDKATRPEDASAIMGSMASNAAMMGPGAQDALAGQLNKAASASDDAGQRVRDALQANASDPKTVALGASMARQLRATNQYAAADAITNLSPEYKSAAAQSAKDAALRSEVDLNTVADERNSIQDTVSQTDADARSQANQAFSLVNTPAKDLPPGVSVEPGSTQDRATLVTRDAQGNVTERVTAQREGDKITLDSTQYNGQGSAQRNIVSSQGPTGPTTVTQAAWKEPASATPAAPPSIDDLKNSRDPNVALSETTVSHDGDALVQSSYTQDAQSGVTQTDKRYSTQGDKDGITDRLSDNFGDGNVDKVDVQTTNIPPPDAKGPDGKPAKASVTSSTSYSQGDVRLTGSVSKAVDHDTCGLPANSSDLGSVKDAADDADSSPKSWTLEKSKTNELDTQTFVEGQTDLSVVSRKKIEGNSVTETTSGKAPNPNDPDGDPVDVSGTASRSYNDQGQIIAANSDQTDATGTHRIQDYQRTEAVNAQGETEVTESTSSSEQPKDGPMSSSDQEQTSVQTAQGPQLVRASQSISTADGTAQATISPDGQDLTVNGQPVADPDQLNAMPDAQRALGNTAVTGLSQQVSDFNQTAASLHDTLAQQQANGDKHAQKTALGDNSYGLYRLQKSVTTAQAEASGNPAQDPSKTSGLGSKEPQQGWIKIQAQPGQSLPSVSPSERITGATTGGVMLATSALGAYTSGKALFNDINQGNYGKALLDGSSAALNAKSLVGGGKAVLSSITGSSSGLSLGGKLGTLGGRLNPATVGDLAGKFSVGLGVAFGGAEIYDGIKNGDGWQIASGAVTAGAAVGGFLAAGAAAGAWGGPAGALVGLGVGALAYGVTQLFDMFDDSEHDVASQQI